MKLETRVFLVLTVFFAIVGTGYGLWSDWEAVGTVCLLLLGGLTGMIGGYLALTAQRIDSRPEDDSMGEIEQGAGDQGVFAPWSWWPLALALTAAICFLGLAVGWWVFYIGAATALFTIVGWVLEFSKGQHAH